MIILIHGDDIVNSRKLFSELKAKQQVTQHFEGEILKKSDLVQIVEGGSLFEKNITIAIEDLFSKQKSVPLLKEIINYLLKANSVDIILWESKEVSKSNISKLENAQIYLFKLTTDVFLFLDSLVTTNPKKIVKLFHATLQTSDETFLFFMILRQIRLLLSVVDSGNVQIDEVKRLSPWQQKKLLQQISATSLNQLISYYKKLYDIDLAQKTGNLAMPLTQTLDFLFLSL